MNAKKYNLTESIAEAVALQRIKAKMPKFQLERAIDGFLGVFLGEYLSLKYGCEVRFMAAEFPIRKSLIDKNDKNFQSTNIDYAYLVLSKEKPLVVFYELKTEAFHRDEQLEVYKTIFSEDGFTLEKLLTGVNEIENQSKKKTKYAHLNHQISSAFKDTAIDRSKLDFQLIYLAPTKPKNLEIPKQMGTVVLFHEFIDALSGNTSHPELFELVKPMFLDVAEQK